MDSVLFWQVLFGAMFALFLFVAGLCRRSDRTARELLDALERRQDRLARYEDAYGDLPGGGR